jgi:hypothetical protein
MTRTHRKTVGTLAAVLAAAALAPGASFAQSTGPHERTATELGQAVGETADQDRAAALVHSRTPTELGQRVAAPATPSVESSGFHWGDAAVGAGVVLTLGLTAFGGVALARRRGDGVRESSSPVVSG